MKYRALLFLKPHEGFDSFPPFPNRRREEVTPMQKHMSFIAVEGHVLGAGNLNHVKNKGIRAPYRKIHPNERINEPPPPTHTKIK